MAKTLLCITLAMCGLLGDNTRMSDAGISIDPDPPIAGKDATITHTPNTKLRIEYTPGGVIEVVTNASGTVTVVIEPTAGLMMIQEVNNPAVSAGFTVSPY